MLKVKIKSIALGTIYLDIDECEECKVAHPIEAKGKEFYFWWGLVAPPRVVLKKAPRFRNPEKFGKWLKHHLPKRRLQRFLTSVFGQKVIIVNS